jgi:2-oxoglutarate ferredoxin oxidoreductase subunit alpha
MFLKDSCGTFQVRAGKKALTATSGPGISLYSEQISFAIGSETPLVIADVQRLGPSTGSATRGADSDIQFLRWGSTGGVPVIVLAPKDVLDCYLPAVHAFNYAEEFRCPVFIASNKEIGLTRQSIDLDAVNLPPIIHRKLFTGKTYLPFWAEPGKSPPFLPIGGQTLVRITSSTHGADGFITTDPAVIAQKQERLRGKIESACERITLFDEDIKEGSEILIISYGVTASAVGDAARILASRDVAISTLTLKTLWPVPEKLLLEKARSFRRIIVFEMNLGISICNPGLEWRRCSKAKSCFCRPAVRYYHY